MEDQKTTQTDNNLVNDVSLPDQVASAPPAINPSTPPTASDDNADSVEEALAKSQLTEPDVKATASTPVAENPVIEPIEKPEPQTETADVSSGPDIADETPELEDLATEVGGGVERKSDPVLEPIKKKALSELEPIIDELDLSPEEKFQTILMIIQTSDKKDLVQKAYDSAEKIQDKKLRAQALLSIVKEIDYFENKD